MNPQLLHDITFYALYAGAALATVVIIERGIFFLFNIRDAHRLDQLAQVPGGLLTALAGQQHTGVAAETLRSVIGAGTTNLATHKEALLEAAYISANTRLRRHLWLLDTIVTAAPLLGLLGTILGIIDTFSALAKAGISDPSGVSAGIGTALFATALGIGVALYGLLFFNYFQEQVERVGDVIKVLLLRGTSLPGNAGH
jgi:biopolymer transport protein ExbB